MPIVFEDVTGEIAPERSATSSGTPPPAPDSADDLREKLLYELALLRERAARLFTD
ncbi:MAG: hypothetical protein IH606_00705 [Burkholderiales bacterium]|nr:hypothetical protein [Burkholderiales bacterium]